MENDSGSLVSETLAISHRKMMVRKGSFWPISIYIYTFIYTYYIYNMAIQLGSISICPDAKTDLSRNWIWTGPMQVLATQDSCSRGLHSGNVICDLRSLANAEPRNKTVGILWSVSRNDLAICRVPLILLCLGWMTTGSKGWPPYGHVNLQFVMIVRWPEDTEAASRTCGYFFLETVEKKNQNFQCFLAFYNMSFSCQLSLSSQHDKHPNIITVEENGESSMRAMVIAMWSFPEIGVPPVIIHFQMGFSPAKTNQRTWGSPMTSWKPSCGLILRVSQRPKSPRYHRCFLLIFSMKLPEICLKFCHSLCWRFTPGLPGSNAKLNINGFNKIYDII